MLFIALFTEESKMTCEHCRQVQIVDDERLTAHSPIWMVNGSRDGHVGLVESELQRQRGELDEPELAALHDAQSRGREQNSRIFAGLDDFREDLVFDEGRLQDLVRLQFVSTAWFSRQLLGTISSVERWCTRP